MSDSTWRAHVRRQTAILTDGGADWGSLQSAVSALFDAFSQAVGLDDDEPAAHDVEETRVRGGKAISPQNAARCVRDIARTSRFLRGVRNAINEARRSFPDECVRVLYAGCGPFATLVLPIAHEWDATEVSFTLIDRHERSLDAAGHLAGRLGVGDRIADLAQVDASTYRCPEHARPHVLIVEAMQRALAAEPQVTIIGHLAPQLLPGGLLVPERVTLHATLLNPAREFSFDSAPLQRERLELGRVMTLDGGGTRFFPVSWPHEVPDGMELFVRTHIRVRGEVCIGDYESGLTGTTPFVLPEFPTPGEHLRFEYELEPTPGLVYRSAVPTTVSDHSPASGRSPARER